MSKMEYELEILKNFGGIDVDSAIEKLGGSEAYFDKLTEFAENSKKYLAKYSAHKILTREETGQKFLQEVKSLREFLTGLGMMDAALDLVHLEQAALNRSTAELENKLSAFSDNIKGMSELVDAARKSTPEEVIAASDKAVILAVDDMPGLISTIVKMLQDKYTVIALTSAKAALKALEKHTPKLFLLDIEMPAMNGYELAERIRANPLFANTPIIFLTAKSTRDDVINAIQHGGNDYIVKPVDKELLLSKIQRFIP